MIRIRILILLLIFLLLFLSPVIYTILRYGYSYSDTVSRIRSICIGAHKTEYSVRYYENKFSKIAPGMTAAQVLDLIGEPFFTLKASNLYWIAEYATGPENHDLREIVFKEPFEISKTTNWFENYKQKAVVVETKKQYYSVR